MTATLPTIPPFPAFPAVGRYVPVGPMDDTLHRINRAVAAREALSLVLGPPGVGKSLLSNLVSQTHRETADVVTIGQAPLQGGDALIQHLLHGLSVRPDGSDLYLQLVEHLNQQPLDRVLLLIVDEAQTLTSEVLETIRMVTNIATEGTRRVVSVLFGGPSMDERLADPKLDAFAQRVATRCYVHPMDEGQTAQYIRQTIESCGSDPDQTIEPSAIAAIHLACGGVPRLINQLMTETIDCAAGMDRGLIDADLVNTAWAQLQQLPAPMVDEPEMQSPLGGLPVEFGALSDPDDDGSLATENELDLAPEAEPPVPAAPTPTELFGDFEDEQSIELGAGVSPVRPVTPPSGKATDDTLFDLERIHRDVVEIAGEVHRETAEVRACLSSEDASEQPEVCQTDADAFKNDGPAAEELLPNEPTIDDSIALGSMQDLEFGSSEAENSPPELTFTPPEMTPVAVARPREPELAVASDDSVELIDEPEIHGGDADILVIDETIELSVETTEPSDEAAPAPPISVDFQAMMNRMRTG